MVEEGVEGKVNNIIKDEVFVEEVSEIPVWAFQERINDCLNSYREDYDGRDELALGFYFPLVKEVGFERESPHQRIRRNLLLNASPPGHPDLSDEEDSLYLRLSDELDSIEPGKEDYLNMSYYSFTLPVSESPLGEASRKRFLIREDEDIYVIL